MPVANFTVTVTSQESDRDKAIADASRYLAYADTTELFGYHGSIDETRADLHEGTWYITVAFSAPVGEVETIERWQAEMDRLSRVEGAECVSNPVNDNLK